MKTLIICTAIHHGNTEKISKVMAEVLDAEVVKPWEVSREELTSYDMVGFGSGIFYWKHHRALLKLADDLPAGDASLLSDTQGKKAFIFSTAGFPAGFFHRALKKKLTAKGYEIISEFSCKGWDSWGPYKFIGGINKGRPNEGDVEKATEFARGLLS